MLTTSCFVLLVMVSSVASITQQQAALFKNNGCANGQVSVEISGGNVVITTNDIPDHEWELCNPHTVGFSSARTYTVTHRTTNPGDNDPVYCVPGGPIGIAINGVFIFSPLTHVSKNAVDGGDREQFDLCEGHPDPQDQYHYHKLPAGCVYNASANTEQILAIMADGYLMYGPYESGKGAISSADLDHCGGRVGPDGKYRYYFLPAGRQNFPYTPGCFRAQPAQLGGPGGSTCTGMSRNLLCECGKGPNAANQVHNYDAVTTSGDPSWYNNPSEACKDVSHENKCKAGGDGSAGNSLTFGLSTLLTVLFATVASRQ